MNRSAIRELAFKLIYSQEIQKEENIEEQITLFLESNEIEDENAIKYIQNVINGIESNKEEITSYIEKNLKPGWKVDRISKVDLSLLKLAIYEIKYENLAYKIVINEVVELAKKYGEEQSKNFVNGILASIVK